MQNNIRVIELLKDIKSLINNKNTEDKWLDINQASKYTSLSPSTLRRGIYNGSLKASERLGKRLIKQSELENWLDGQWD